MFDADPVIGAIADAHLKTFENELYEFIFCYKTEDTRANGKSIIEQCERVMCEANNVSYDDYINDDMRNHEYDDLFQPSTELVESVINEMIRRIYFPEGVL